MRTGQQLAKNNFRNFDKPADYIGQEVQYSNWAGIVIGYDETYDTYQVRYGDKIYNLLGRKLLHKWQQMELKKYSSNLPSTKKKNSKKRE